MIAEKLEPLLQQLTLEEKVSLLAGASMWYTTPVERLGIPAVKVTDGPNGARGDGLFASGKPAACFPVGIALAATWNPDLLREIGVALAEETKSKGAHVLLAPTVNIHRSTLNGRNFECYSEDPYLTGELAVGYIEGVQSQGISATIKHYIGNESEFERMSISSEIPERALREIYLPPFKAAVQRARVWAVMSSYNAINGVHASSNPYTLDGILRDEFGFDGIVMSDWFSTRSTAESVNAGQDLEMPGPTIWRGDQLLAAVQKGEVSEATLDRRVRDLLRWMERVGAFDRPASADEQAIDRPEHRALIRRAGAEAIVLLKNNGVLPITPEKVRTLAVIGPNAKTARIMGGGSAQIKAHYAVSPFEGVMNAVGESIEIGYAMGCANHRALPVVDSKWSAGGHYKVEYFNSPDLSGPVAGTAHVPAVEFIWFGGGVPEGVNPMEFSARIGAPITTPESGTYAFSTSCAGKARVLIDGQLVADNWTQPAPGHFMLEMGSGEAIGSIALEAGRTYDYALEYSSEGAYMMLGVRGGCFMPLGDDAIDQAVALASESDAALVFVGLTGEWESEGFDRPDMELVGQQNELVARVAAANPNTVVVVQTGSPITMPWIDQVAGLIQAWYPGQECGHAIADVVFGRVSPSGKLPQTFPQRLEDNPAYGNYPGENGQVHYAEGIFVGYRHYEHKGITPLFPFGFGLSYTTFAYNHLRLSANSIGPDQSVQALADVTNTGSRAGAEVAQLYVRDVDSSVERPPKELKGFAKVMLQPGETKTVTFTLDRDALAFFDEARMTWVAEAGAFEILVGGSSVDTPLNAHLTLTDTATFGGPAHKG